MTNQEINEIKEAIAHINYTRTVPGRYYDLCRAVLPMLEFSVNTMDYWIHDNALRIARVVNQKQPLTILEEKGKKGTSTFQEIKSKPAPKLHPEIAKRLKKEGRIIEKGKGK